MTPSEFPPLGTLAETLRGLLAVDGWPADRVTLADRSPSPYASSFSCEVVRCRRDDGAERRLFCKYSRPGGSADPLWHRAHGHRRGVAYEAEVYRSVLEPLEVSTPRLYGAPVCSEGRTWLVLEYLDTEMFVNKEPRLTVAAAGWIGRFHALTQDRLSREAAPFLSVYDAEYYRGWADRMLEHAGRLGDDTALLKRLVARFEESIELLLAAAPTVIHGEYYPSNVLARDGIVHPVDWESAAVAAGEIDLASLTERWSPVVVAECEEVYRQERWPEGAPDSFSPTLEAARLYMTMRWVGEACAWSGPEGRAHYREELRATAERLGVA